MAIANITGNILTDSGIATSSFSLLSGTQTFTGANTFTQNLALDGNGSNAGTLLLKSNSALPTAIGYTGINTTSNTIYLTTYVSNPKTAAFDLSGITDNTIKIFTLPNTSGTLALTSNLSAYLPLTGGTLTGALSGTSATFTSGVFNNGTNSTNGIQVISSLSGSLFTGGIEFIRTTVVAGSKIEPFRDAGVGGVGFKFLTTANNSAEVSGTYSTALTLASTGAATFSSSVGIGLSPKTLLQINGGSGAYPTLGTNVTNSIFVGRNDGLLGMYLGYAADGNGWIQQMRNDSATAGNLILQPSGGAVNIGTTTNAYAALAIKSNNTLTYGGINVYANGNDRFINLQHTGTLGVIETENAGSGVMTDMTFRTGGSERMRITSGGIINTTSRLNVNGAGDNSLFSLINNGTTYTLGFSPNATASTSTTLTITTATTTWVYNGTGTATWTLPNPSGTNQMFWIKNAGTGVLTLNAFSGTNIINNSATAVSSITIAVGATALIQQDGNVKSYQLQ